MQTIYHFTGKCPQLTKGSNPWKSFKWFVQVCITRFCPPIEVLTVRYCLVVSAVIKLGHQVGKADGVVVSFITLSSVQRGTLLWICKRWL